MYWDLSNSPDVVKDAPTRRADVFWSTAHQTAGKEM